MRSYTCIVRDRLHMSPRAARRYGPDPSRHGVLGMYSILAAAFLIMTIGMTGVLCWLGWQQHQIEKAESQAEKEKRAETAQAALLAAAASPAV
jgi:hypothetical protein